MKKLSLGLLIAVASLAASAAYGQSANFSASRTFEYDPDKTGTAVAYWDRNIGETDKTGNTKFGLELEKNNVLTANVAAGAVLNGLKGVVVKNGDTMSFDMTNSSGPPQDGPRFNVSFTYPDGTPGFSFVGGFSNATKTPGPEPGWTHCVLNLQNPAQAFPAGTGPGGVIPEGSVLESVVFIVDNPGKYTIDNLGFRDQVAGKPGSSN
jgi:hypothetical protein